MYIVQVLLILIVVGVLLWLVNTYLPIQQPIKTIINIVVTLLVIIWLLGLFGLLSTRIPLK